MNENQNQTQGTQQLQYQTKEQSQANQVTPPSSNKEYQFAFSNQDETDKELRKPRSRAYVEIFDAIDMLSVTDEEIMEKLRESMDEDTLEEFAEMTREELMEEIRACFQEEFQKLKIENIMLGVLSKCYISGCDCHAISPAGEIMEHYSKSAVLQPEFEKGRALLKRYRDCKCVEVYTDCCRVIHDDNSVTKVDNNIAGFK